MKRTFLFLLASLLVTLATARAEDARGTINFQNVSPSQVLTIYKKMSGLELVIDSRVSTLNSTITLQTSSPGTKAELMKLMEKVLIEQAGIVITRLDDKRASVTFNDALPRSHPKKP